MTLLPEYKEYKSLPFYKTPSIGIQSLVPTLEQSGVDLLESMLRYDATKRINAQAARHHEYFDELPLSIKVLNDDMS